MRKFLRSVLRTLGTFLLIGGLAFFVLRLQGICPFIVLSGSMEPGIPAGGLVFTDTRNRVPSRGDVITYRLRDGLVTHRVVGKKDNCWITRGDANKGRDPVPVEPGQILGIVRFSLPFAGYLCAALQNLPLPLLILIMIVLLFPRDFPGRIPVCKFSKKGDRAEGRGGFRYEDEEEPFEGGCGSGPGCRTGGRGNHRLSDGL